jgi:hypothetical protein
MDMRKTVRWGVLACILALTTIGLAYAAPPEQASLARITSPRDGAVIRGTVAVEGAATHPQFNKYELHYAPEPNPTDQWTPLSGSPFAVPVVQGRLALWDTGLIPDGSYQLRLRVVRTDGNYDEYFVHQIVVANTRPTETPTPAQSPTPRRPTDTPTATPTVVISFPETPTPPGETAAPTATPLLPTPQATATPRPSNLPFSNLGSAACWGGGITFGLFVAAGVLFAFKATLVSLFDLIFRRRRRQRSALED